MNNKISKKDQNKQEKKHRLLASAYKLFLEKGYSQTTIQEIIEDAQVAKGTFYLYFHDKEDIKEQLIIKTSEKIFHEAITSLENQNIKEFPEQVIFILNYVIDKLNQNKKTLLLLSKDLSLAFYKGKLQNKMPKENFKFYQLFMEKVSEYNIQLKNPEITLFMMVELISSTCFRSILENCPLPIEEYKPYLYDTIRKMLEEN